MKIRDEKTPCVIIRPNLSQDTAYIIFGTQEEKKDYMYKEFNFCRREQDAYFTANASAKKQKIREYLNRRVTFAKSQDFAPHPKDRSCWVKTRNNTAPMVA